MVHPSGERPEPAEYTPESTPVSGRVPLDSYIRELAPPAGAPNSRRVCMRPEVQAVPALFAAPCPRTVRSRLP